MPSFWLSVGFVFFFFFFFPSWVFVFSSQWAHYLVLCLLSISCHPRGWNGSLWQKIIPQTTIIIIIIIIILPHVILSHSCLLIQTVFSVKGRQHLIYQIWFPTIKFSHSAEYIYIYIYTHTHTHAHTRGMHCKLIVVNKVKVKTGTNRLWCYMSANTMAADTHLLCVHSYIHIHVIHLSAHSASHLSRLFMGLVLGPWLGGGHLLAPPLLPHPFPFI